MEISIAEVKQQLDNHEKHCDERHQAVDSTLIRLSSDMENMKENMAELRADMRVLRGEMANLRSDVDRKIDVLRSEMRWNTGFVVGFITLAIAVSTYINQLPS